MSASLVVAQPDAMVVQEVGQAWGATIISVVCDSQEQYDQLPAAVKANGLICGKCSFHDHIKRAYYRSSLQVVDIIPISDNPTELQLERMSNEELVAAGYLTIERRGLATIYRPTRKFTGKPVDDQLNETIIAYLCDDE